MRNLTDLIVFNSICSRRATANFSERLIPKEMIIHLLNAARWAPSASNRRIQKFIVIHDRQTIRLVRQLSPGMRGDPQVLILICNDCIKAKFMGVKMAEDKTNWIDIGSAAQNIMLAAHELGLASCPLTSFSKSGVRTILDLPGHLIPEYIVQLGFPAPSSQRILPKDATTRISIQDFTIWHSPRKLDVSQET